MATLRSGSITLTSSAQPISASQPAKEIMLQAALTNTNTLYVGTSQTQPYALQAGDTLRLEISNVAQIYGVAPVGSPVLGFLFVE